jgi:hypothetical protein
MFKFYLVIWISCNDNKKSYHRIRRIKIMNRKSSRDRGRLNILSYVENEFGYYDMFIGSKKVGTRDNFEEVVEEDNLLLQV